MQLLKKLCEAPGISGYESQITDIIQEGLKGICDKVEIDRLGNVIALKKATKKEENSKAKKVMLAAHMDQIGFLVKSIDQNGFIRFAVVGGFDPKTLVAQRVIIHGKKRVIGVIGSKPIHVLEETEKKKAPAMKEFFIDIGLEKKEVEAIIQPGDAITFDRDFVQLNDKMVTSLALDNRAGVYVIMEAIRRVRNHHVDIYAVATSQEEVGLRGATTSSYVIEPDIGIAVDVTMALDTPGIREEEKGCALGKGTAIAVMNSSMIAHRGLFQFLKELAEKNNINYQMDVMERGGTDAGSIQKSRHGVITGGISVPTRYIHSVVEMCHIDDIEATIKLLVYFLENVHLADFFNL
ncbi:MAG: M42 family metallopeptidase [Atribacterota bacterium]|nr:M42 family metallopeptidase [Atribacterota bacterium]MDD4896163.1 M42 family metallopeptidase [Atribacterota bacterium]MDD5637797.1 M42 family metallopeptidase [Atribacterota bacterium]